MDQDAVPQWVCTAGNSNSTVRRTGSQHRSGQVRPAAPRRLDRQGLRTG